MGSSKTANARDAWRGVVRALRRLGVLGWVEARVHWQYYWVSGQRGCCVSET